MPSSEHSPFLLLAAVAIALVAACSSGKQTDATGSAPGRGVYVPLSWHSARNSAGHRVHVTEKHVECTSCHELTGTTMGKVSPVRCRACHEKESTIAHASAQARSRFGTGATADCTLCHAFAAPPADGGSAPVRAGNESLDASAAHALSSPDCLHCHRVAQGDVPAIAIHDKGDACLSCHRPHVDDKPKAAPCLTCHKDVSAEHAAHGGESGCKGCHTHQHAKAAEALGTCQTCHASHEPIIPATALFGGGHENCEMCHRPHEFSKELVKPCRSCHENVHVLGEAETPKHQQCTSCHSPHDVRGSPKASCVGCHGNLHPDHPKIPSGGPSSCVGCHDPHPTSSTVHGLAKPCSSCHTIAKSDVAFHSATECEQCHKPHDFVLEDHGKEVCHKCHETKFTSVAKNPGHQACASCHGGLPHEPTSGMSACPTCHAKEHDKANPGHLACTNCHEPHGGAVQAPCKNCHAAEASTAPAGHSACLKCHEQHSGAPEHAACVTCHADKAQTAHGKISADCASCHKPHGPAGPSSPPPCATCHQPAKLPGLHTQGKHTECLKCHTGHDDPTAAMRAPCLACHTDRKDHFPDAPRCASCHLFE